MSSVETGRSRINEIKLAIDRWALNNGHEVKHAAHQDLAAAVYKRIKHHYRPRVARKGLLVDTDENGDYCNPRIVDWDGAEETLYPEDPNTGEPVEEAVAAYAFPLPHPDEVPDL